MRSGSCTGRTSPDHFGAPTPALASHWAEPDLRDRVAVRIVISPQGEDRHAHDVAPSANIDLQTTSPSIPLTRPTSDQHPVRILTYELVEADQRCLIGPMLGGGGTTAGLVRSRRRLAMIVTIASLGTGGYSVARAQSPPQNNQFYSQNYDAEDGTTTGWTSSGWGAERYTTVNATRANGAYPYDSFPASRNSWLFVSHAGAQTLTQRVSVQAAADEIDSGGDEFAVAASLGGTGAGPSEAVVAAQPTDAAGQPVGAPLQLGPPTAADRDYRAELVGCRAALDLTPGTRGVTLSITSTSGTDSANPALADDVLLVDHGGYDASLGTPAQAEHCTRNGSPTTTPTPTPTATPTPTPTAAPAYPVSAPLRVRRVRLTHRRVSFTATTKARFHITIARRGRVVRHATATGSGRVSRRVRQLRDGRYRVVVRAGGKKRADVRHRLRHGPSAVAARRLP
jgi:hypothetical protein